MSKAISNLGKRKRMEGASIRHQGIKGSHGLEKRDASTPDKSSSRGGGEDQDFDEEQIRQIFQRAYEKRFKSLGPKKKEALETDGAVTRQAKHDTHSEDEEKSDWDGCASDENDDPVVIEVVSRGLPQPDNADEYGTKLQRKTFMTAKPPPSRAQQVSSPHTGVHPDGSDSEADQEAENVKNDLSLQKLLRESTLLQSENPLFTSSATKDRSASRRHRANDLAVQAASRSASSLYAAPVKTPMKIRQGMNVKAQQRHEQRRQEARENGIILERAAMRKNRSSHGRSEGRGGLDRGVGLPSVGKLMGGTLRLSKRDVDNIQGTQRHSGKAADRRRRR